MIVACPKCKHSQEVPEVHEFQGGQTGSDFDGVPGASGSSAAASLPSPVCVKCGFDLLSAGTSGLVGDLPTPVSHPSRGALALKTNDAQADTSTSGDAPPAEGPQGDSEVTKDEGTLPNLGLGLELGLDPGLDLDLAMATGPANDTRDDSPTDTRNDSPTDALSASSTFPDQASDTAENTHENTAENPSNDTAENPSHTTAESTSDDTPPSPGSFFDEVFEGSPAAPDPLPPPVSAAATSQPPDTEEMDLGRLDLGDGGLDDVFGTSPDSPAHGAPLTLDSQASEEPGAEAIPPPVSEPLALDTPLEVDAPPAVPGATSQLAQQASQAAMPLELASPPPANDTALGTSLDALENVPAALEATHQPKAERKERTDQKVMQAAKGRNKKRRLITNIVAEATVALIGAFFLLDGPSYFNPGPPPSDVLGPIEEQLLTGDFSAFRQAHDELWHRAHDENNADILNAAAAHWALLGSALHLGDAGLAQKGRDALAKVAPKHESDYFTAAKWLSKLAINQKAVPQTPRAHPDPLPTLQDPDWSAALAPVYKALAVLENPSPQPNPSGAREGQEPNGDDTCRPRGAQTKRSGNGVPILYPGLRGPALGAVTPPHRPA